MSRQASLDLETDYIYCELIHAVARTYKLMGSKNYSSEEVEVVPSSCPAGRCGGRGAWGSQGSWGSGDAQGTADLASPGSLAEKGPGSFG